MLTTIVLITAIAPLATDMYVPAFPLVGHDFAAPATQVQLTLTTFFVGMALGQLAGGPFSDRVGRRRPLLAALVALVVASVVCAFSPTVSVMMTARLVQGFAGGWAMVIARSVVVDLTEGARMVRAMNVVAAVAGTAPVVGPLLGALVLSVSSWRVSFWVVAALAAVMLAAVAVAVPETLPVARRQGGGLRRTLGATGQVLSSRVFSGHLVVFAFSMGTTFAYVATSAYVLQSMNGLTPVQYSVDFAANAAGMTAAALVAARYAHRIPARTFITVGLAATGVAGTVLAVGAGWFSMPLPVALGGFFVLMTGQGLVGPNAGALASAAVPRHPGTGSALLGFLQWVMAGTIAPLAALGGQDTAVPMATIVLVLTGASTVAHLVAGRHGARA
ncbi:MFS transporter, DHA1 family, bicyclomycin/chloramphenicol resistance protein [Pedococcus dokdonensis]|uniref:MFS transporter, DHA1 family, bicyclomycin/chloramphenicol resistance protein n=1 Tax=Pedococcus dokdonensis TaxID=443156 RepID=A0A1H0UQH8_9MICO|nr:Bcr/CflA family efflux MFS transporter [Pedococcus dokdonensis]SDP68502.1 MFS transporter, DHA1 family, bicyclomycin/chloramphenicol resistance protein [Pedococcus dokdonensis]